MPLDGIAVSAVVYELQKLIGGRVDKIYQPEPDEIDLIIRSFGSSRRLLLSAQAACPRVHITGVAKENPMTAPVFCMTLRKHLSNGKILSICQPAFDRIIQIEIESVTEMGDLTTKILTVEMMGKHSNIILTDNSGKIIDSIKRVPSEKSSLREVLPGRTYVPPPTSVKDPQRLEKADFFETLEVSKAMRLQNALYKNYNGISPIMAGEVINQSGILKEGFGDLSEHEKNNLFASFSSLLDEINRKNYTFFIIFGANEKPEDFFCVSMTLFPDKSAKFESISEMLDVFYQKKDLVIRMSQKTQNLRKAVTNHLERCYKKMEVHRKSLDDIEDRETFRIHGELITAHIYSIKQGMTSVSLLNYLSEAQDQEEITIPLDPLKTPAENAQKYFKRYNKEKRSFEAVNSQIVQNAEEIRYLESVLTFLQNASDEHEMEDIRKELAEQGYVKRKKAIKGAKVKRTKFTCFFSSDGFEIYVGKNNAQNDELTLKFADNSDIWFHVKDIPGSHVIVKTYGKSVPDRTLEEAAHLAAYFSKGRDSSLVPVDYVIKKHVKKPAGARPGMVIYERNKTAYITPSEALIESLKR